MARLSIQSEGFAERFFELHLGVNTFGRSPENDWQVVHPTISSRHCEIEIESAGLRLRDCGSTNGTFVNGELIKETMLQEKQMLRMGDVEFLVENADVKIAIPKFEVAPPAPPVVLPNGEMICQKHPDATVTYRCTHCLMVMCSACVRRMRRRGGKPLLLCPKCSHQVEPLGRQTRKKKGFIDILRTTVKMPFFGGGRKDI